MNQLKDIFGQQLIEEAIKVFDIEISSLIDFKNKIGVDFTKLLNLVIKFGLFSKTSILLRKKSLTSSSLSAKKASLNLVAT